MKSEKDFEASNRFIFFSRVYFSPFKNTQCPTDDDDEAGDDDDDAGDDAGDNDDDDAGGDDDDDDKDDCPLSSVRTSDDEDFRVPKKRSIFPSFLTVVVKI